nr:esterase family protein [Acidobacteriota bacterium]
YSLPYNFIIVMPDGGKESWYVDNVNLPNDKYESYFIKELIPEIDAKYRTIGDRNNRIIAGLSMGGYGAVKFGLKYPEKFVLVGSFSGAMDAVVKTQNYKHLIKSVADVFGDENSQARKENDIFKIINESSTEKIKNFSFLFVDCGTEDHQFQSNRDFVALLTDKKVRHEYRQKPGVHNWAFWDSEVREFLRVADEMMSRKTPKTEK